jgi:probable HAF family extracellular repeat protein
MVAAAVSLACLALSGVPRADAQEPSAATYQRIEYPRIPAAPDCTPEPGDPTSCDIHASGMAINDLGDVVVRAAPAPATGHSVLVRRAGGPLISISEDTIAPANGFNDAGQVALASRFGDGSALVDVDEPQTFEPPAYVTLPFGSLGALNEQGQVTGTFTIEPGSDPSCPADHPGPCRRAGRWHDGVLTPIGTLGGADAEAEDVNELGDVVGTSTTATGERHGFLWADGTLVDLGPGFEPRALNDHRQIVGSKDAAAYAWQDGALTPLAGEGDCWGTDVNDAGVVIGHCRSIGPVVWRGGVRTFLPGGGFAADVNERGEIVGGSDDGLIVQWRPVGPWSPIIETFSASAANFAPVAGGTWAPRNGRYVLTTPAAPPAGPGNSNLSVHTTVVSGDYTLDARAAVAPTPNTGNDFSIVFGYQDPQNTYWASLSEQNSPNDSGIFRLVAGVPTEIADIPSTITAGTTYRVRVQRAGGTIRVSLNDAVVAEAFDTTFSAGQVGFGSRNDASSFDDLSVQPGVRWTVLAESFSAPMTGFTPVAGGTWAVRNGRYVLSAPAAAPTGAGNSNVSVHPTVVSGDFTLSVRARVVATSSAWNDFSIVFAYQDAANACWVSFGESNGLKDSGIFCVVAGSPTEVVDILSTIRAGTAYRVRVEREGTTVRVYRDDVLAAEAEVPSVTQGMIGFGSRNDAAWFDDLLVTVPA